MQPFLGMALISAADVRDTWPGLLFSQLTADCPALVADAGAAGSSRAAFCRELFYFRSFSE